MADHQEPTRRELAAVTIRQRRVPITTKQTSITLEIASRAIVSKPFQQWIENMECCNLSTADIEVSSIEIQSVDFFGSKVGFIKIMVDCSLSGTRIPGICFLRGAGVGILIALRILDGDGEDTYSILVEQPRLPVGKIIRELPAGMMDDNGNFSGVAAMELKEECGITVKEEDLIDLTELAFEEQQAFVANTKGGDDFLFNGLYPSPGGCDEFLRLMYYEHAVTRAELTELEGKLLGLREHGELIQLRVVKFNDIWKCCSDAKALW